MKNKFFHVLVGFGSFVFLLLIGYFAAEFVDRHVFMVIPGLEIGSEHIDMVKPCLEEAQPH